MENNNIKYSYRKILSQKGSVIYFGYWSKGEEKIRSDGDWLCLVRFENRDSNYYSIYRNRYTICDTGKSCLDCDPLAILNDAFAKYGAEKLTLMSRIFTPYLVLSETLLINLCLSKKLHTLFPSNLEVVGFQYNNKEHYYADNVNYKDLVNKLYKIFKGKYKLNI